MAEENSVALNWDSVVDDAEMGSVSITLPEGDYDFTVVNFERAYYNGSQSGKIPACPMARITIVIDTPEGSARITEQLKLCSSLAWVIASFFKCLGLRKSGEKSAFPWNQVVGAKGKVKVSVRTYTGQDGSTKSANSVAKWLPPTAPTKFTPGQF